MAVQFQPHVSPGGSESADTAPELESHLLLNRKAPKKIAGIWITYRPNPIMSEESPKRQRLTFQQQILPPEDPERELRDMFAQARL
ncbi:hypothetical protein RhiTH_005938 [Rhizoctonia solani]